MDRLGCEVEITPFICSSDLNLGFYGTLAHPIGLNFGFLENLICHERESLSAKSASRETLKRPIGFPRPIGDVAYSSVLSTELEFSQKSIIQLHMIRISFSIFHPCILLQFLFCFRYIDREELINAATIAQPYFSLCVCVQIK